MAIFKSAVIHISLLLASVAFAQRSNPYLTYSSLCPSATIAASSAKVSNCEQSIYGAVMSRADCQPVPVASCECEWFNSWISTCLPNICPSTGLAAIASSQGPAYCTPTGTDSATATGGTITSTPGGATSKASASQEAATTTAKAGGGDGLGVPLSGGLLAGLVGILAVVL